LPLVVDKMEEDPL